MPKWVICLALGGVVLGIAGLVALMVVVFASLSPPPQFPDPGTYHLPDVRSKTPAGDGSLNVILPNERITLFSISTADLGEIGNPIVFQITGDGYLTVQAFTADGITCPKLTVSDSEFDTMIIDNNVADGLSFGHVGGSPPSIIVASERAAQIHTVSNSSFDKIIITAPDPGPIVERFILNNISGFNGACVIRKVKADTFAIINSIFGSGDGLAAKDFVIESTVTVANPVIGTNYDVETDVR